MSYTIDERNPERQRLLAEVLGPPTREALGRLPRMPNCKVLDLGCGQGNTTRLLAEVLDPAVCVGLEYDPALVDYAETRPDNPSQVSFQQGDATQLPFEDASFDVVFCRYLLIHMSDPGRVVSEMLRVVRPGGYAVAYEGDFIVEFSEPPCEALKSLNTLWQGLFQNPSAGRKLVRYFREAGGSIVQAGAVMQLDHGAHVVKRVYRLTAEAIGPVGATRGLLTQAEVTSMIEELARLEADRDSVLVKFPDVWAIAQRA